MSGPRTEREREPGIAARAPATLALACPECRARLDRAETGDLLCPGCRARFPRRAEVPVLLDDAEWRGVLDRLERDAVTLARYSAARRRSVLNVQYYDRWIAEMFEAVPPGCSDAALELMCGEAELCRRLPDRFREAAALDLNARMIESAARALRRAGETRVTAVCGNALRLPFADATFSAVLVQGGFHHVRPILQEVLREVRRVLRPGGILVGSEPANDAWLTTIIRHWQYARSEHQGNDPDEDGLTRAEVGGHLSAAGLRLETYRNFGFVAYPLMANMDLLPLLARSRSRSLGESLTWLDGMLEKIPGIRSNAWMNLFTARRPGP